MMTSPEWNTRVVKEPLFYVVVSSGTLGVGYSCTYVVRCKCHSLTLLYLTSRPRAVILSLDAGLG